MHADQAPPQPAAASGAAGVSKRAALSGGSAADATAASDAPLDAGGGTAEQLQAAAAAQPAGNETSCRCTEEPAEEPAKYGDEGMHGDQYLALCLAVKVGSLCMHCARQHTTQLCGCINFADTVQATSLIRVGAHW